MFLILKFILPDISITSPALGLLVFIFLHPLTFKFSVYFFFLVWLLYVAIVEFYILASPTILSFNHSVWIIIIYLQIYLDLYLLPYYSISPSILMFIFYIILLNLFF